MMSSLAALEEENKHLRSRIKIFEQSRLDVVATLNTDEKIKALGQERKLLEQHLEEAHLQLSDIKSVWSSQNLALETQLARLSSQVAEETTEKRRAVKEKDDCHQKVKTLEFDFAKLTEEVSQKDCKVRLCTFNFIFFGFCFWGDITLLFITLGFSLLWLRFFHLLSYMILSCSI